MDSVWSDWSNKTFKELNLNVGVYEFKLKAKNVNEIESSISSFKIEILPPWYRTSWAYLLYTSILGIITFVFAYILRSNKLIKVQRKQSDELTKAIKLLTDHSEITNHEVEEFINHKQTFRDYLNLGVDIEKISVAKKRNAKSGISMWNVINGVTDFASHNYGYNVNNSVQLQIEAGNMLCKNFDISNTLDVSPY